MRTKLVICALAAAAATPALGAPWVQSYVVDKYEPAFYYGAKIGTMERGTDCPKGTKGDNDYKQVLKTAWRSDAEIASILKAAAPDPNGTYSRDGEFLLDSALAHRGFRKDVDSWINPFAAPDPGMQEVTGKIAEGFDLDNNSATGGFTSPAGQRGIDNALYRAWGCGMAYRGVPYSAYLSIRGNDKMLEGLYTMVVRISGNQSPMNDSDAVVEVGYSPDHVVKNAASAVDSDYSFRIVKTSQYSKMKAHIRGGVVETEQVAAMRLPAFAWFENNRGEVLFNKGRMRLTINADGSMNGLLGGYRDWRDVYAMDTFDAGAGAGTRETFYRENQISKYYALKRDADGLPDPRTGRNTGISAAYRFTAVPAYVVDPSSPAPVNEPRTGNGANIARALFVKAATTQTIARGLKQPASEDEANHPEAPAKPTKNGLQASNEPSSAAVAGARN